MTKTKPNWLIDCHILESETDQGDFLPALAESGSNFYLTRYIPFHENEYGPEEWMNQPTILYGSWNYIKNCNRQFFPGAYGFTKNLDVNMYYSQIESHMLLNGESIYTTFGQFKKNYAYYYGLFNTNSLFIRPLSGFKTFAGLVVHIQDVAQEINSTMQLSSVMDDTFIMVAPNKNIINEWRFLIVNHKVISGSLYKSHDKTNIKEGYNDEAFAKAKQMAENPWQPDAVYICDVCENEEGYFIVELNSFSCAGLYAMDKKAVIDAVNDYTMREWESDYLD